MDRGSSGNYLAPLKEASDLLDYVYEALQHLKEKVNGHRLLTEIEENQVTQEIYEEHSCILTLLQVCINFEKKSAAKFMASTSPKILRDITSFTNALSRSQEVLSAYIVQQWQATPSKKGPYELYLQAIGYTFAGELCCAMESYIMEEENKEIRIQFLNELREIFLHLSISFWKENQDLHDQQNEADLRTSEHVFQLWSMISTSILKHDYSIAYASARDDLKQYVSEETAKWHEMFWSSYKDVRELRWNKTRATWIICKKTECLVYLDDTMGTIDFMRMLIDSLMGLGAQIEPVNDDCPVQAKKRRLQDKGTTEEG